MEVRISTPSRARVQRIDSGVTLVVPVAASKQLAQDPAGIVVRHWHLPRAFSRSLGHLIGHLGLSALVRVQSAPHEASESLAAGSTATNLPGAASSASSTTSEVVDLLRSITSSALHLLRAVTVRGRERTSVHGRATVGEATAAEEV
mmetsp:Transcript_79511/g.184534  ORF Transcript_79511/g.184534 Transcript_79511/m.184534 type:complete len:147 (-) Transcript_79511:110-550(-)